MSERQTIAIHRHGASALACVINPDTDKADVVLRHAERRWTIASNVFSVYTKRRGKVLGASKVRRSDLGDLAHRELRGWTREDVEALVAAKTAGPQLGDT